MSDNAHSYWAMVAYFALMTIFVITCTLGIAYLLNSAAGLWSILLPLLMNVSFKSENENDC